MSGDFLILGIVNITPDSFSDGGEFFSPNLALAQCQKLLEDGADILDLGAQSTRPGSEPIAMEEEWRRLEPVLVGVKKMTTEKISNFRISIDTDKFEIARMAALKGADYINNIKGLFADGELEELLKINPNLNYIAMHCHKNPKTMQDLPLNGDKGLEQIVDFFDKSYLRLLELGFDQNNIWLDPGIGFGKSDELNLKLMSWCMQNSKNYQFTFGISRKSFLGRIFDLPSAKERDQVSKMLELGLVLGGIKMIRTHDVKTLEKIRRISR